MAVGFAAIVVLGAACGGGGQEAPNDGFYSEGDRLEIIVPTSPGGGTDTLTRFLAPYLAEELGVEVLVRNIPGGGTVIGINEYVNQIEPDGYTLLMSSSSGHMAPIVGKEGVRYGFDDITPIAAFPVGGVIYSHGEVFAEARDLTGPHQPRQAVYAGQPPSGASLKVLLPFELLKTDVNAVLGFSGSGDARLAWERGEADIRFDTSPAYFANIAPLVEEGKAAPLISFGRVRGGEVVRDPVFPDLPTPDEVYENVFGEPPSGHVIEAYKVAATATITMSKSLGIHAAAPEQAKAELTAAWKAIAADPDFRQAAETDMGVTDVLLDADVTAAWSAMAAMNPKSETMQWLLQWLRETYDVQLNKAEGN